jgi:hypothetical protein
MPERQRTVECQHGWIGTASELIGTCAEQRIPAGYRRA